MRGSRIGRVVVIGGVLLGCAGERHVLGAQCPSPYSEGATRAHDAGPHAVYGTSCAPCDTGGVRLDVRGCPVYVTFESCGGDLCLGSVRLRDIDKDAGADEDAGASEDSDAGL
jgi:hypothetical protein